MSRDVTDHLEKARQKLEVVVQELEALFIKEYGEQALYELQKEIFNKGKSDEK